MKKLYPDWSNYLRRYQIPDAEKPNVILRYHNTKKFKDITAKNVVSIYTDKGEYLGNLNVVEGGNGGKVNDEDRDIRQKINSHKNPLRRQKNFDLLTLRKRVKDKGELPVRIENITPGKMEVGKSSISVSEFKKNNPGLEYGTGKMGYKDDTGKPFYSITVNHAGMDSKVEFEVETNPLSKEDVDRLTISLKDIPATSLKEYFLQNPELTKTVDYNRSAIRKLITEGNKEFASLFTDDGTNINISDKFAAQSPAQAKITNLGRFYEMLKNDEKLRDRLYRCPPLEKGQTQKDFQDNNGWKLTEGAIDNLKTYFSKLSAPELHIKWDDNEGENKKSDKDAGEQFGFDIKGTPSNIDPDSATWLIDTDSVKNDNLRQMSMDSFFEDPKESKDTEPSLTSIFGNSSVVNNVKNVIYDNIGFSKPGDIVSKNGEVLPYKTLADKIADYRKQIKDSYDKIPDDLKASVDKDNYLSDKEKQKAFILKNLNDDAIFDLFVSKLYPDMDNKTYYEDNTDFDVKRNIDSTLKNILSSIPLIRYGRTESKWDEPMNSGYTVNSKVLLNELQSFLKGVKSDAEIKQRILDYTSQFKDRVGGLEDKENAILSFRKLFFGEPDIKDPGKYSYSFIRDNKPAIESRDVFPMLAGSADFQKHAQDVSNLMNHFYSLFGSNTVNNYISTEFEDGKFSSMTASAEPSEEIKNKLQSASNTSLIGEYAIKDKVKELFDSNRVGTVDGKIVVYGRDKNVLLREGKAGELNFSFDKNAKDKDISKLFADMGISHDFRLPSYFSRETKGGGDIQFTKDRLATIAGVFSTAIRAAHDKEFSSKYTDRLNKILKSQNATVENPTGVPLPADFHQYIRHIAQAQHAVTEDAFRDKYINDKGDSQQTTVLGSHLTEIFDNGSKPITEQHQDLLQVPEYNRLRNTLNQVKNGIMSFDKIGLVDGIKNITGKSVRFGKDATPLDVLNMAFSAFKSVAGKFNIMGEYGGDGSNIRMYPLKIEGVTKLTENGKFTKEFQDYAVKSMHDIFNIYHQEFHESKNKWKKYIGKYMPDEVWNELSPSELRSMFDKHIESLKKAKNKQKLFDFIKDIDNDPDLIGNKDKIIKYDYDNAVQRDPETGELIPLVSIKLGHASTFNEEIDPVFNGTNFYLLRSAPEFDLYSKQVYENFYNNFLNSDLADIRSAGVNDETISDNDIKAYSLLRMIALKNISPLAFGDENQYKSREDYQKRTKESPGMRGAVNAELSPEQMASITPEQVKHHTSLAQLSKVRTAIIPDIHVESNLLSSLFNKNEVINRSDGKQIINPFYEKQFTNSFGGEYGPMGKGAFKLRTKGVNPITGIAYDDKCQTMRLNWELIDKSSNHGIEDIVPESPRASLDNYLKLMLSPRLHDMFKGLQKSSGTKAAIETMQEGLREHPEWHDEMIHFLSHESVRKTGIRSRNIGVSDYTGLQTDTIESKNILHQLNLDKDEEKQVLNRQLISALGIMLHNSEAVEGIDRAQMNKLDLMWKDIDKHIGVSKDSPEFTDKLKAYLQSESAKGLDDMNYNFLSAVLMSDPKMSVDMPMLSDKVQGKLIGLVNKGILSKMQGLYNVNDDSVYYKYRVGNDGNRYDYTAIRKMGSENAMKLGLHELEDKDYQIMRYEDQDGKEITDPKLINSSSKVVPADMIGSYSKENQKRFGVRPGEDVTDIFSIHFKDGSFINTENYTSEKLAELLSNTDPDNVDIDKTPMFRENEKVGQEGLADDEFVKEMLKPYNDEVKKMVNYHKEFSKSLDGISIRIPYSGMPFGKISRLRSFINDYGSIAISNGDWNRMDGQDLDGDKQMTYGFQKENIDKPEIAENNYLLKQIMNVYGNPENYDVIFHPENIDAYKEKTVNHRTGMENTMHNYDKIVAGKQCIAIEASFSTIYKALYRVSAKDPSVLGNLKINDSDLDSGGYGKHISAHIATILQMALDNAKEDVLGRNNVNQESIKVLNAILMSPGKVIEGDFNDIPIDNKIKEGFSFLRLPDIRNVYDEYFKTASVGNKKRQVSDIISNKINDKIAGIATIEQSILSGDTKPETEQLLLTFKSQIDNLQKLKELEMLGEGVSQLNAITKIYTKGIANNSYERYNMLHGSKGLEYLLNAPADKIFGTKEDFERYLNDKSNENYFMSKSPVRLSPDSDAYKKELARQKDIRKNVDYKKFFELSSLLKKQWESYYTSDEYLKDSFLNRKPFEQLRDNIKASTGIQNHYEDQSYKLEKEINKFLNSVYYASQYSDKRITTGDNDNWYSLGNTLGRERFSQNVVSKLMDIKSDERYRNNKAIQMLEISSTGKENRITLKGGNRVPPEAMLDLQKAMKELDNRKDGLPVYDSGFRSDGKPLSMYDVLSHYTAINDNFMSGGNSIVNLFDQKAYKNFSNWLKNDAIPKIDNNQTFTLRNDVGNKIELKWDDLLNSFKDKLLSDNSNSDLLLNKQKASGAEYHKDGNKIFKNDKEVVQSVSNSGYGYDVAKDLIGNDIRDRDLNNEGEAPVNTPKDIQLNHYQGKREGEPKSDIEHFLKKTSDPIIQNERLRNLAESYLQLPNVLEGLKNVKISLSELPKGKRGVYVKGEIHIDKNDRDISQVFMHEIHHALLNDVLTRPESKLSDYEKEFKQSISTLFEHAKKNIKTSEYGLTDLREFVAEAFSNPKFQDKLMKVKSFKPWTSVWKHLVQHLSDFVSKVLGIDSAKLEGTLLNDVFASTKDYLNNHETSESLQPTFEKSQPGEFYLLDDKPKDYILTLRTSLLGKPVQSRESVDADKIREGIRNVTPNRSGDRIYAIFGDRNNTVNIGKGDPTEDQIQRIQEMMQDISDDKKEGIISAFNSGGTHEAFADNFKTDEGDAYYSEEVVNKINELIEFDQSRGDRMLQASEYFKELNIPADFNGNNPIIIVHGNVDEDKDPAMKDLIQKDRHGNTIQEISILDLTTKAISGRTKNNAEIWNTKTEHRFERQLRNFQLAVSMMKIKEVKDNVRFKRAGIICPRRNDVDQSFDLEMSDTGFLKTFQNFLATASGQKFMDTMPQGIQDMLKNPKENPLFKAKYDQDYMWQLMKQWQQDSKENPELYEGAKGIKDFMTNGGKEGYKLEGVLKYRVQKLERMDDEVKKTMAWKREYNYLDHCLYDIESNNWAGYKTVRNISHMSQLLSTPANIGNPYLDFLSLKQNRANRMIVNETLQYKKDTVEPVIQKMLKNDARLKSLNSLAFVKENATQLFDKYIKKIDAIDKDGKIHRVNSKMIDTDTEEGKFFADQIQEHIKDIIRHQLLQDSDGRYDSKSNLEREVEKQLEKKWTYGMVPYLPKELGEKLFGASLQKLVKRATNPNESIKDLLAEKESNGKINNYFAWQMGNHIQLGDAEKVGKAMGITIDNTGQWHITDMKKLNDVSYNFEHILTSMKMNGIRQREYDNEVIPAYDRVRRLADEAKLYTKDPLKELNKYFDNWKMANINQTSLHLGEEGTIMRNIENVGGVIKDIGGSATTAVNPVLIGVVGMANTLISSVKGIANTMGNTHLFGVKELLKSAPKLISERKLMGGIGDMYGVMNMSQRDVTDNPNKRILKKSWFSSFYTHFGIYAVDYTTREWLMAAQMLKNGKYDAHTFNDKTGKVEYDEKKDRQFWGADGTQTPEQKSSRESLREELIRDKTAGYEKLIENANSPLPKGYGGFAEQKLKDISDQVIYDMSDNSHVMAQNTFIGQMMYQFKRFGAGQVEQAFAAPYQRMASGHEVIVEDEYGNKVAKWQPQDYEGGLHSMFHTLTHLKQLVTEPGEFWSEMTPKQKANLVSMCTSLIAFGGMWLVNNQIDKKKNPTLAKILTRGSLDLVNPYNPQFWTEVIKEPLPLVNFAISSGQALWYAVNGEFDKALRAEPIGKGGAGLIEQMAGYEPVKKKPEKKKE